MKEFLLLLVGYGNVARRFASLLGEQRSALLRDRGLRARIVGIATRHHGCTLDGRTVAPVSTRAFLGHALEAHADAAKQGRLVVVETTTLDIERGEPAIEHVRAALAGGAHVVTANKGPVAFAYRGLARWRPNAPTGVPVRRRRDGRRADLQPGARDAAGGPRSPGSAASSTARRTTS